MTPIQMRTAIASVYKGRKWKRKVDNMTDNQVTAIYLDFLKKGKFDESKTTWDDDPRSKRKPVKKNNKNDIINGEQLEIF